MTAKKAFVLAVLLTLVCILPIFLIIVIKTLYAPVTVTNNKTDIPILKPQAGDCKNVLFISQNPEPVFLLVRIDAVQNKISGVFFPKDTIIIENKLPVTIEKAWLSKGPAQVQKSLNEMFSVRIDNYYQIDIETLTKAAASLGTIRVKMTDFEEIKNLSTLKKFAYNGGVTDIGSLTAQLLLSEISDGTEKASLRSKLYTAFLHSDLGVQDTLTQLVESTTALTDLTAVHRQEYLKILGFFSDTQTTEITFCTIPVDQKPDCLELNQQSTQCIEQYFY